MHCRLQRIQPLLGRHRVVNDDRVRAAALVGGGPVAIELDVEHALAAPVELGMLHQKLADQAALVADRRAAVRRAAAAAAPALPMPPAATITDCAGRIATCRVGFAIGVRRTEAA